MMPCVRVSYRDVGATSWKEALPLTTRATGYALRAVPSLFPIAEQFAGSIFNLRPDSPMRLS